MESPDSDAAGDLDYDVAIVGGGPSGLATAYHLRHQALAVGLPLTVCLLEKSARIGGHLLSGALVDPTIMTALIPNWLENQAPVGPPVLRESIQLLTAKGSWPLVMPAAWGHLHERMIALGPWCRWLASQAEALGVDIFPGFAAVELLFAQDHLVGIRCGDLGRNRLGTPKPNFVPGARIRAKVTVLAEGCRGSLTETVITRFGLADGRSPQVYGLGFKELWEIPDRPEVGDCLHTLGWPLPSRVYGGGFLLRPARNRVALGLVIGLDYEDPWFDPLAAFQTWKGHPLLREILAHGRLLAYGARTMTLGGEQAQPRRHFPGGLLVGDGAGVFHPARQQGITAALTTGKLAAETILDALTRHDFSAASLAAFTEKWRHSAPAKALVEARNVRPGFRLGLWPGLLNAGWEGSTRGRSPWTWRMTVPDRVRLRLADSLPSHGYPSPDGITGFDSAILLAHARIHHPEDQPNHLMLVDSDRFASADGRRFANPETRYCPGRVFSWRIGTESPPVLDRHPGNCLHCKTCEIKDPLAMMRWTPPEGGSGPDYGEM